MPAPVFVVATANRVESLPPELFRPGRFDQVFFLDLPDPAERRAVLEIHLRARRQTVADDALDRLAGQTEGYSAAELEQVVKTACLTAFQEGGRRVTAGDLEAARPGVTPLAESVAVAHPRKAPVDEPLDPLEATGLHDIQREHILRVLNATHWVIEGNAGAALKLGMKPATLRHRMKKLGIARPELRT